MITINVSNGERVRVVCGDDVLTLTGCVDGLAASLRVAGALAPPFSLPRPENDVVRVKLPSCTHTYAYRCPGAKIGDLVRVLLPGGYPEYGTVMAPGRGGYNGSLKDAELVPVPR